MSLGQYSNFIDPTQIPQNVAWMVISWGIHFGLKKLLHKHPVKFNRNTIRRTYLGLKLFGRILSFVITVETQFIIKKFHIQKFNAKLDNISINHLMKGFMIFKELEPKAAMGMVLIIKKYEEQYRINKITGLDIQPDLTKIDDEIDSLVS